MLHGHCEKLFFIGHGVVTEKCRCSIFHFLSFTLHPGTHHTPRLDAVVRNFLPSAFFPPAILKMALLAGLLAAWIFWLGFFWMGETAFALPRTYPLDATASRLRLIVFRGGAMAALAHNHVMLAEGISGEVKFDPGNAANSSMELTIPVSSLRVDLENERRLVVFKGKLDDDDRAEIREIMLSLRVLDAAKYPNIEARVDAVSGTPPNLTLSLRIRIKGVEKVFQVPAELTVNGDRLEVRGKFKLLQTDYGIEPYSTLFGAIAVKDEMRIVFALTARARGS